MARFGEINAQYFDDAGDPLSSGKIYFYETGTTTLKDTFSDINQTIANTNPVILTAAGRQPNIFFSGTAKAILVDKNDAQILVRDPIGQTASVFGDGWVATKIYSADAVVLGSDGQYYRSLAAGNQNNDPTSTSGYWTLLYSVEWNAGITYQTGAVVTYNNLQYQSLQNSNLNNNPASATAYWASLAFAWLSTRTYAINENVVGTDGILYTSLQNSNTGNVPASSGSYWVGTSAAAAASATAAANSATAAATSATNAATSATNAGNSATAAATSATNAAASATTATTKASEAATSATNAATSETNAGNSATAAATSATNAGNSATAAANSATAAATSETNAGNSATAAATSATNAASSATSAASSATTATTKASEAATSATNAATSETNAGNSATAAGTSATNAATSATAAAGSATSAASSATDAANKYDEFDDRYLGAKSSDPTVDNDGNALVTGAIYFNTSSNVMKVYGGSSWANVAPTATSITLSQVSDVTATATEVNVLDGIPATLTATELGYVDGVTSSIQTQLNNISVTAGTLTKTFAQNEVATISLSGNVVAPVVSVTKEINQTGVTNNSWDVNSTSENYTRYNSAPATTLTFSTYAISTAAFVDSFSVSSQETQPTGLAFNTDGTKMFLVGENSDAVQEYALSTGFDVSTASYTRNFSVSSQETAPSGIAFNADGTKMFISGEIGQDINEYAVSTGFDLSSVTYTRNFSVSSQDTDPRDVAFSTDGTKMFVLGRSNDTVFQYTLSTGFDLSTASYASKSFSVTSQENNPKSFAFSTDGTKMFILGQQNNTVYRYTLSTAFDVSTASYDSVSFSVASQETLPDGIAFNTDGTKMFVTGQTGDDVNEYTVGGDTVALGSGSFASADVGKIIEANGGEFILTSTAGAISQTTAPTSFAQVASGSWQLYGLQFNSTDGDLELSGNVVNDFTQATKLDDFDIGQSEGTPTGLTFSPDGTVMVVSGDTQNRLFQYTLSTGFDLTTASYANKSYDASSLDSAPRGVRFNNDGTKIIWIGEANKRVYAVPLTTAYDLSTASGSASFNIPSAQTTDPTGLEFNPDGTIMYIVGRDTDECYQYTLSTGFDVTTATYANKKVLLSSGIGGLDPRGLFITADGTKLYHCGTAQWKVFEFEMSTPFDVSTASYTSRSKSINPDSTELTGVFFTSDAIGKMYVIGQGNDYVVEYTVKTATYPTTGYHAAHTTLSTDSTYWTDINSMTASESAGSGNIYYCVSTDDRTTWKVAKGTDGERSIVRNNSGTWQYNSNGTYGSETWTNATVNAELYAIQEAMGTAANQMNKTQLDAIPDANQFTLGNDLDLAIIMNQGSGATSLPSSDGVSINYDAAVLNQGAVHGTDYTFDAPAQNKVRITALAANNLKVRVV